MMRLVTILLLAAGMAYGQATLSVSVDRNRVDAGDQVTLRVELSGSGVAALQWELFDAPWTSLVASKQITCNAAKCVMAGLNQDEIQPGPIAEASVTINQDTTFTLTNPVAASPDGELVPIVAGQVVNVAVFVFDLDGSGSVDVADVQHAINQAIDVEACQDTSGDNVCTVVDVQRVVNAALGS